MQASHNRFEHSLGVAHLAYKFGSHLWQMQRGELDIERRDLELVSGLWWAVVGLQLGGGWAVAAAPHPLQ